MGGSLDVGFSSSSCRLTLSDPDCWGERAFELLPRRLSFAFVVAPSPLLRWVISRDAWIALWNSLRPLSVRVVRGASFDDIVLPTGDTLLCGKSVSALGVRLAFVA